MSPPKYREAQVKLRAYIATHGLVAGDQLPPEEELASAFGMSRLSLREAVKSLETVGVLRTQHGGGTYVQEFSFAPLLENLPYAFQFESRDVRNLLELRAALEEGLVPRATEWVRRRDLEDLRSIAAQMAEAEPRSEAMADLDREFHHRLYAPLQNKLVTQVIDLFWEIFHRLQAGSRSTQATAQQISAIHARIVDALAVGDIPDVVQAMREHFEDIRGRLAELPVPTEHQTRASTVAPGNRSRRSTPK